jgi:hypothetical protein
MNDVEVLICSPLSGEITRAGVTIRIWIFQDDGSWRVAFLDHEGEPASWPCGFATDQDALNEVIRIMDREGISRFLREPEPTLH